MADRPPAEKLPLAVRKNVRDGWTEKKDALEAQVTTLLGVPWTFEANASAIYPYAEPDSYGSNSLGDCIFAYFDGFVYNLKYFLEKHGEAGKNELNSVCAKHAVTLSASTRFSYCGAEVVDGELHLIFHPNSLGTNINDVGQKLADALSEAPQPAGASPLSYAARHSIAVDYEPQIGAVLDKIHAQLHSKDFVLDPNFEALGAKLKTGKDVRDDWEQNLGSFALGYFESFLSTLQYEKFVDDDLLREGLEEVVTSKKLVLRLVDKLDSGYNQILVDDDTLVIQTTPANWGTNISNAASALVSIL